MKERPILFSAPMVRAILDGKKYQTRRVVRMPQRFDGWVPSEIGPDDGAIFDDEGLQVEPSGRAITYENDDTCDVLQCPYGVPGDRLWVRETSIIAPRNFSDNDYALQHVLDNNGAPRCIQYLADAQDTDGAEYFKLKKIPSIFMPRWASRITLEIADVRVERLNEISETDAEAEGVKCG